MRDEDPNFLAPNILQCPFVHNLPSRLLPRTCSLIANVAALQIRGKTTIFEDRYYRFTIFTVFRLTEFFRIRFAKETNPMMYTLGHSLYIRLIEKFNKTICKSCIVFGCQELAVLI
jgi:hypothetical protein